jgi:acetate---CoA ligase (ADP-forming) subunit alpha
MLDQNKLQQLDRMFHPKTVAIIGATKEPDRVGFSILSSLIKGGYPGKIFPIHPRHKEILGIPVLPNLEATGGTVDLVVIALNEKATVGILEECGRYNVAGAICVAGGFKEIGHEGVDLQEQMVEVANRSNILLLGPNTLGMINAKARLNATFWPIDLRVDGTISIVSQSGGIGQVIGFKTYQEGLNFNKWIGVGNHAMLDFDDLIQYLGEDQSTEAIGVFLEGTDNARSFIEIAGHYAYRKPVVVLKAGQSTLAQTCTLTHTGSMAGPYQIYEDVFRQFGLLSVNSPLEFVSVLKAVTLAPPLLGNGVAIITPSAGPSILLVDKLELSGANFVPFREETYQRIKHLFVDVPVILKNPLDAASAGYSADSYLQLVEGIIQDPGVDQLIAITIEHAYRRFPARDLVAIKEKYGKPILVYYIGSEHINEVQHLCHSGGIPLFASIEETAWGATGLIRHLRIREEFNPNAV